MGKGAKMDRGKSEKKGCLARKVWGKKKPDVEFSPQRPPNAESKNHRQDGGRSPARPSCRNGNREKKTNRGKMKTPGSHSQKKNFSGGPEVF